LVSLNDIIEVIEILPQEADAFLDPTSGEIVIVTPDDHDALCSDDPSSAPEWQRPLLRKAKEALESDRFVRLPTSRDLHEGRLMRDFCDTLAEPSSRELLLDAIHSTGAFRRFRTALDRCGAREQWFAFRKRAITRVVQEWLTSHGIVYAASGSCNAG
jgi:hypothetical protein